MAIAYDALRVGRWYRMTNYGETREFQITKRLTDSNYILKDRITLEEYELQELVQFGRGKDYDLDEINDAGEII